MKEKLDPPPADFDENPEWTEADGSRTRAGQPPVEQPKVHIGFRLAADVVEGVRATGQGYNASKRRCARRWRRAIYDRARGKAALGRLEERDCTVSILVSRLCADDRLRANRRPAVEYAFWRLQADHPKRDSRHMLSILRMKVRGQTSCAVSFSKTK
ncbi:MAG: BrnA antitoxin family protein [Acetobacteraceae bacterium]